MGGKSHLPLESCREDTRPGRPANLTEGNAGMNADGMADRSVVPSTRGNNAGTQPAADSVEERDLAKRNAQQADLDRSQKRNNRRSTGLAGVRIKAQDCPEMKFTSLLHHVNEELLTAAFFALKKKAAVGVDEVTWQDYEIGLEDQITDLHGRIHRGAYRAKPSKRIYLTKPDGQQRPIGIASLEDKIVQKAVAWVLQCIYEKDFVNFSYGHRPGRSQHMALDALSVGLTDRKVNWVLDGDVEGFFDAIDHEWLVKFLEHRIADNRIFRLIGKWLRAGVSDDGQWSATTVGTPQGAVTSPLLAKFGLKLHDTKTRLIEFGRQAARHRQARGERRPEMFDFLGFTHRCDVTRAGWFALRRESIAKRMRATLAKIKIELRERRHHSIGEVGRWLKQVVRGWFQYHAVPGNQQRSKQFCDEIKKMWLHQLRRRSQRHLWTWTRFVRMFKRYLPEPTILHPYPSVRFLARLEAGAV